MNATQETSMTATAACRAHLANTVEETKKLIARGGVYPQEWSKVLVRYEALLAKFDALKPDVDAILALDKDAIRSVSDKVFDVVQEALWCSDVPHAGRAVFGKEVTRRKAARTKAARAAEAAKREEAGQDFTPGQTVGVHAFGHWYTGKVIRLTRMGSVVVEYTSGTGTTRQKTVGYDKVRA